MRREYTTARTVIGFLEMVAWTALVVGVIGAVAGIEAANEGGFGRIAAGGAIFVAALPRIAVASIGLIGVVACQLARAGVDTAEMTGKLLDISEEQLRIAKSATPRAFSSSPRLPDEPSQSGATGSATARAKEPTLGGGDARPVLKEALDYRGHTIAPMGNGVLVEKQYFASLPDAKQHVDGLLDPPPDDRNIFSA